jgi:hypothetical protein
MHDRAGLCDMKVVHAASAAFFSRGMVDAGGSINGPHRLIWRKRG